LTVPSCARSIERTMAMGTVRTSAPPWRLLRDALGGPALVRDKTLRFAKLLAAYTRAHELDERLRRLERLGYVTRAPTRLQLAVGAADMLRFFIVPAAEDYYASKGISFTFHQLLRFLDDPASVADPTGFLAGRDVVIGHLMQVVHANPAYDLQLLESYDDGLAELESQVESMLAGTHPRVVSIGAIIEDPDYHARLLTFVRAFREDRRAPPPIRENFAGRPDLARVERTFGTLPAAMRYIAKLPSTATGAALHLLTVKRFPIELAEPEPASEQAFAHSAAPLASARG